MNGLINGIVGGIVNGRVDTIRSLLNPFLKLLNDENHYAFYDSENLESITKDGSELVSRINDVMGSGVDLTTGGCTFDSNEGFTLDGVLQRMKTGNHAFVAPQTIYMLVKMVTWANNKYIIDGASDDTGNLAQTLITGRILTKGSPGAYSDDLKIGTWGIVRITFNGANSELQVNNFDPITFNAGATNMNGITIGGPGTTASGYNAKVNFKALLFRKNADSENQRNVVLKEFRTRYYSGISNVLVLGNSITKHPINGIYWWGLWGMAASKREYDFVHVLESKMRRYNQSININGENIAAWEGAHTTYDKSNFDDYFNTNPGIVIVRLGENVSSLVDYDTSLQGLVDYIKTKAPNARIVITGNFWESSEKDAIQKAVADANFITYVSLNGLDTSENKSFVGDIVYDESGESHVVENAGVASHPNNAGMAAIASRIFDDLI